MWSIVTPLSMKNHSAITPASPPTLLMSESVNPSVSRMPDTTGLRFSSSFLILSSAGRRYSTTSTFMGSRVARWATPSRTEPVAEPLLTRSMKTLIRSLSYLPLTPLTLCTHLAAFPRALAAASLPHGGDAISTSAGIVPASAILKKTLSAAPSSESTRHSTAATACTLAACGSLAPLLVSSRHLVRTSMPPASATALPCPSSHIFSRHSTQQPSPVSR
mmetsp:Transcript_1680/g.3100  ORF Transcript_1680/g.3100 Transcript_1680/m.3100 type:complete len:219 (+) Transcript_1680:360-1016(+)